MKSIIFFYLLISLSISQVSKSQLENYLIKNSLELNIDIGPPPGLEDKKIYDVVIRTNTIPVTYSRIEKIDGKYQIGQTITVGYGLTRMHGTLEYDKKSKYFEVVPSFFYGIGLDTGPRIENGIVSLNLGLSFYFGLKETSISFGGDLIRGKLNVGLASNFSIDKILKSTATLISASLRDY